MDMIYEYIDNNFAEDVMEHVDNYEEKQLLQIMQDLNKFDDQLV